MLISMRVELRKGDRVFYVNINYSRTKIVGIGFTMLISMRVELRKGDGVYQVDIIERKN